MWTSQKTSDGKATGYAYGWGVHEENGVRTVGHTGGQPGCSSAIWMLPGQGFAVTIMANTDEVKVLPIAEALAQAYLHAQGGKSRMARARNQPPVMRVTTRRDLRYGRAELRGLRYP